MVLLNSEVHCKIGQKGICSVAVIIVYTSFTVFISSIYNKNINHYPTCKHTYAYTVILRIFISKYYGFPRLYRRFAEFNQRVTSDRQVIRRRQEAMKFVFRIPNKIVAYFR